MSRKNRPPKAPKIPRENQSSTDFDREVLKGVAIGLVIVILFSTGHLIGALTKQPEAPVVNQESVVTTVPSQVVEPITTPPATTVPAETQPAATEPAATETQDTTPADTQPAETTPAAPSGAPQTKAEIVAYFNTAANKIKTDASKVTRNFEDLQHNEEKLVLPSALQSVGSGLISQFLKKDETPVDYTGADITAQFPVKGQSFVSNTTEADIKDATCTDEGDSYRIKLNYVDAVDPSNTSVANAFNIINPDDVYSAASMVKNFTAQYYNATIECTVDKATGRITWISYTLPIVLSVTASLIVTLDAQVGMTFIDDYSISY